jgi:hypothetical protein
VNPTPCGVTVARGSPEPTSLCAERDEPGEPAGRRNTLIVQAMRGDVARD